MRLVPRIVTPCHWPPTTLTGRTVHSVNTEPLSLQPSKVASKKFDRSKSQATNAEDVCTDALKRQLWNVHRSNSAPLVVASLRSTSVKVHST